MLKVLKQTHFGLLIVKNNTYLLCINIGTYDVKREVKRSDWLNWKQVEGGGVNSA